MGVLQDQSLQPMSPEKQFSASPQTTYRYTRSLSDTLIGTLANPGKPEPDGKRPKDVSRSNASQRVC